MVASQHEGDAPDDRCGYTYDMSTLSGRGSGAVTCWWPTGDDRDRCIWHADEDDKPPDEESRHPGVPEFLTASRPTVSVIHDVERASFSNYCEVVGSLLELV